MYLVRFHAFYIFLSILLMLCWSCKVQLWGKLLFIAGLINSLEIKMLLLFLKGKKFKRFHTGFHISISKVDECQSFIYHDLLAQLLSEGWVYLITPCWLFWRIISWETALKTHSLKILKILNTILWKISW